MVREVSQLLRIGMGVRDRWILDVAPALNEWLVGVRGEGAGESY
jgi:hypothetical protein